MESPGTFEFSTKFTHPKSTFFKIHFQKAFPTDRQPFNIFMLYLINIQQIYPYISLKV